ncbi:MAG: PQQ-binding-like beta-propeller repeat protein, partial [Terriglobales bacterium]
MSVRDGAMHKKQKMLRPFYLTRVCFAAAVMVFGLGGSVAAQDAKDWITINKDYSSQRYVDLDQITPQNVGGLKESCEFQLNEAAWFSSGLLMVDRTIYVDTMRATYAIDATTCALRWRTVLKFGVPANISNRGPAYLDGTIFRGTVDGRVVALDAKTGDILWDE